MEGNQLLSRQSRVLLAATAFALTALGVFLLVWFWPMLTRENIVEEVEKGDELSVEQKMAVLAQIRAANPEIMEISLQQKTTATERVSKQDPITGLTQEEKMHALQILNQH